MSVDINNEQDIPVDIEGLAAHIGKAMRKAGCVGSELSLLLTNDASIAELNLKYRGISGPTDVLSFSLEEDEDSVFAEYMGDIVISVETARGQAQESLDTEIKSLALHGLAHLLGHDHETEGWEPWQKVIEEITPDE